MVFHRHFGGVFHLFGRAADDFGVCTRRHGAGDADFALAANVRAGDGGVGFVEDADGACGEQEVFDALLCGVRVELAEVVQDGGDDAGGVGDMPCPAKSGMLMCQFSGKLGSSGWKMRALVAQP